MEELKKEPQKNFDLRNVGAILCFVIAGFIAVTDHSGWGWFLLIGLLAVK